MHKIDKNKNTLIIFKEGMLGEELFKRRFWEDAIALLKAVK